MTVEEMVRKYNVKLASGGRIGIYNADRAKKDKMVDIIVAAKPEIVAYLTAEKEATERAATERKAKIAAIEGLKEIQDAIMEHENYRYKFNRMMEDEFNDGVNPPTKPQSDIGALKKKYPRAAAYLKADSYAMAANYAKAGAGSTARERIINGEDYEKVIADMEKEWSDYCNEHIWD